MDIGARAPMSNMGVVLVAFSHGEDHLPYTSDDLIFRHMVQRFNISPRFQHSGEIFILNPVGSQWTLAFSVILSQALR